MFINLSKSACVIGLMNAWTFLYVSVLLLFEATWHDALFVTLASECFLFRSILTQCYWFTSSILRLNIILSALTKMSSHRSLWHRIIVVRWSINRMVHNRWKFSSSLLSAYSFGDILEMFTRMHLGTVHNSLILLLPLHVITNLCRRFFSR